MATAFFSYSRRDSEFALRLAGDLKAAGKSVWIDQLDIVPGEQWDRAIEKDLGRSPIMLVILSPSSVESDNVMDEVSFALRERKRIIPIICKNCRIPFRLDRLQRVDFTEDYDRGLNDLLKALDSGEEVGPNALSVPEDPSSRFQSADAFRAALSSVPVSDLPKAETTVTPTPETRVASTPAARQSVRAVSAGGGTAAAPAVAREAAAPTPAPVSPPSAAPVAPVVARPSSRGAWVAMGALMGAGALIAAGIYVPRQFRAHADPNKTVIPDKDSVGPPEPTTTASTAKPDTPSAKSAPVVSMQSDQGSMKVDENGSGAAKMSDKKGAGVVVTPAVAPRKDLSSGNPAPARAASPQMPVATAPPAQPSGPSAEEIAKIEEEADKLNIRGATASKSLDTLRQQQNAAGYNLRADIAASQERMQLYLAKGNDALKAQDYAKAQKYFDLADAEINKVEKFLGH